MENKTELNTFTRQKLRCVVDATGCDDYGLLASEGTETTTFYKVVAYLCGEIKKFRGLNEEVTPIVDKENINKEGKLVFLLEFGAFLYELGCEYLDLMIDNFEVRFGTTAKRLFLFEYLCEELKFAKLLALRDNKKCPVTKQRENKTVLDDLHEQPKRQKISFEDSKIVSLELGMKRVAHLLEKRKTLPKPLFTDKASKIAWYRIEQICMDFSYEIGERVFLLIKRADLTFNTLLWSDAARNVDKELWNEYTRRREQMRLVKPLMEASVLSCCENMLLSDIVCSKRVRAFTKAFSTARVKTIQVKNRGGRLQDLKAPALETFQTQELSRQLERGGFRGGHASNARGDRGSHGSGGFQRSFEDQARGEYQNRYAEERGRGGGRGRGRGRGGRGARYF